MNIYLDESYNLQKSKGKMFISINGFSILNDRSLRKRWQNIRKPFTKHKRRIHATDPYFKLLRIKSLNLLNNNDVSICSVFQLVQEVPPRYFNKQGIEFESVYFNLLCCLLRKLRLGEYKKVRIIIDARKHQGGTLGANKFVANMEVFLKNTFSGTICSFRPSPSYTDTLVELADFVSNSFYKDYLQDKLELTDKFGSKLIQIKNPL